MKYLTNDGHGWGWYDLPGYEGLYQVHPSGLVKSLDRDVLVKYKSKPHQKRNCKGKLLKPTKNSSGYLTVDLRDSDGCRHGSFVHRLVALAFIEPVAGKCFVNHIDEDKLNNDLSNLEWCTHKENITHSIHKYRGDEATSTKLTEAEVLEIVRHLGDGVSQTELGHLYGVSNHTICKIKSGEVWGWLTGLGKGVVY